MTEMLKQADKRVVGSKQVLRALNGGIRMRHGAFRIDEIYTRAENVFQGFTTDEVDNQYLMSPFCGFRFHGTMTVMDVCV